MYIKTATVRGSYLRKSLTTTRTLNIRLTNSWWDNIECVRPCFKASSSSDVSSSYHITPDEEDALKHGLTHSMFPTRTLHSSFRIFISYTYSTL